jgi:hypothetical protein
MAAVTEDVTKKIKRLRSFVSSLNRVSWFSVWFILRVIRSYSSYSVLSSVIEGSVKLMQRNFTHTRLLKVASTDVKHFLILRFILMSHYFVNPSSENDGGQFRLLVPFHKKRHLHDWGMCLMWGCINCRFRETKWHRKSGFNFWGLHPVASVIMTYLGVPSIATMFSIVFIFLFSFYTPGGGEGHAVA